MDIVMNSSLADIETGLNPKYGSPGLYVKAWLWFPPAKEFMV